MATELGPRRGIEPQAEIPKPRPFTEVINAYLDGYYKLPWAQNYYREIPEVMQQLLSTVLDSSAVTDAEVISSIPKSMAAGSTPVNFWDYPRYFADEYQILNETIPDTSETVGVKRIVGYGKHGPADIDIKFRKSNAQNGVEIGRIIYDVLHEAGYQLSDPEVTVAGYHERKPVTRTTYEILGKNGYPLSNNLRIKTAYGPIITNPSINGAEIFVYDKDNNLIFKIHPGEMPLTTREFRREKRFGDTNNKQDGVRAELSSDGQGQLFLRLNEEAEEVMKEADSFPAFFRERAETEPRKDIGQFAEIALRALRTNLLFPLENLVNFDYLFPFFDSKTLFQLRRDVHSYRDKEETLPANSLALIKREFLLCLTIDPYLTVQFLKDTHFGFLIPGLSRVTTEDWEKVLYSRRFQLGKEEGKPQSVSARTPEALVKHREEYINNREKYNFQGVEMFMEALEEVGLLKKPAVPLSCWLRLDELFSESERKTQDITFSEEPVSLQGPGVFLPRLQGAPDGSAAGIIFPEAIKSSNRRELRQWLIAARRQIDETPDSEALLKSIKHYISSASTPIYEHSLVYKPFQYPIQLEYEEIAETSKMVDPDFLEEAVLTFYRFPGTLTAREIFWSLKEKIDITDEEFAKQFLYLKWLGLIDKDSVKRIKQETATEIVTDLYSLHRFPLPPPCTRLNRFGADDIFPQIYSQLGAKLEKKHYLFSDPFSPTHTLIRSAWPSFEVLSTLTRKDLELLAPVYNLDNIVLPEIVELLAAAFAERKRREESGDRVRLFG